jgi:hypothetical protein
MMGGACRILSLVATITSQQIEPDVILFSENPKENGKSADGSRGYALGYAREHTRAGMLAYA